MKTKAAILYELNRPLRIAEVEIPSLRIGQTLVRILCTGVCRAQYNEIIGLKGPDKFLPHLLGHEGTGIIEAIGPQVTKVKKGDYVALSWIKGNGLEAPSTLYRRGDQLINAGAITTFSEYSVISENRITKISRRIKPDDAAVIGCAVATGAGIVNNTLNVRPGSSIAVFGIGGIGASAILAAKVKGCKRIIAVDILPKKFAFAKKLGATHTFEAGRPDLLEQIRNITAGGLDYAIDASGNKTAMENAFAALHNQGVLVIAGNLSKDERISLHPFELIKGKRILGTWGGETVPQRDFPKYVRAFLNGKFPFHQLITHRLPLEEINHAFDLLKNGDCGRIIIEFPSAKNRGRDSYAR